MFNVLTNYEFGSVMHIHEHACTPHMHVVFNMFETAHNVTTYDV